ncbi:MAG TPA: helix-turn-helix transcriptional regulator [Alphaproteobacteria bacterium]|nr:helix-turn-helix transcriptional regulator [Alphaproteobacteria bacterium]
MTSMLTGGHRKKLRAVKAPISRAEYRALVDRLEDLEDAFDLMQLKAKGPSEDAWPAALVDRMLAGESKLRLWREHRGLTLAQLGKKTGIAKGYLSEVENGKKPGSVAAFKKCARVLRVDLDDLVRD